MDTQPISIDSVVLASGQVTPASMASPTLQGMSETAAVPAGPPAKGKGRKRLLMGLKRMASSTSLRRSGSPSSRYGSGGKGSISCISLSSASCSYGSSYASELSAGFSTAPTSVVSTPGREAVFSEQRARVRILGLDLSSSPTSVGLPSDLRPSSPLAITTTHISETAEEDYFSTAHHGYTVRPKQLVPRADFNFWADLPPELRASILMHLTPKEIVRCSSVSKNWHDMCFDGQLWSRLDTVDFYSDIPATALVSIVSAAGPFIRDLNLRGCVQLKDYWGAKPDSSAGFAELCHNLQNFSLEGTGVPRMAINTLLLQNTNLVHVNLSGLMGATNHAMKVMAQHCPKVEHLNVSWCRNIDVKGLARVVAGCPLLKDLRAGETVGWNDLALMEDMHERNTLETLLLPNTDITDEALTMFLHGPNPEMDFQYGRVMVPPRKLKHLDLTRCGEVSDDSIKLLAHNAPDLEGLQLSKIAGLSDASLTEIFPTMSRLTHVDLEELEDITNASIQALGSSPSAPWLQHLSISYCENVGDSGMLVVLKNCPRIDSLDMDNTRISDLVLTEAAASVRARNRALLAKMTASDLKVRRPPRVAMRLVAYDCANVTWMGVREILSRNTEFLCMPPPLSQSFAADGEARPTKVQLRGMFPNSVISLKCFYNYQPTVDEHMKRVLRGDWDAARRLERKWADWMMLNEEAGAGGTGGRRRRRRAREAMMMHADEEDASAAGVPGAVGLGRRRRARSGGSGCLIM